MSGRVLKKSRRTPTGRLQSKILSDARRKTVFMKHRTSYRTKYTPGELHAVDLASAIYPCDIVGTITALNLTAQGDDIQNRQGRQIYNQSIRIQGMVQPFDATAAPTLARVMLIWDSQPSSTAAGGTLPVMTDILSASTSISNTNLNNRERFTVLRDEKFAIGGTQNTATQAVAGSPTVAVLDWFVSLKGVKTTYGKTTTGIDAINTGALLMVTIGNQGVADGAYFIGTTRLRFSDN